MRLNAKEKIALRKERRGFQKEKRYSFIPSKPYNLQRLYSG
jgi:hypothetical protein